MAVEALKSLSVEAKPLQRFNGSSLQREGHAAFFAFFSSAPFA
jgi:hypothetical protein